MVGPPAAAAPFLDCLPAATTPAAETATDARESGPAIRSPSATRGGLNLRKILRRGGDVVGPARGLRVGRQGRGRREQTAIARQSAALRIDFLLLVSRCPPMRPKRGRSYSPSHFGPRQRSQYVRRRCWRCRLLSWPSGG